MRAYARRAVVAPARFYRQGVEGIHGGAIAGKDRDMQRLVQSAFAADPEIRLAIGTKTGRGIMTGLLLRHFHHEAVAKGRQRSRVEGLGALIIGNRKADVVDHHNLPEIRGQFTAMKLAPAEVQLRTSMVLLRVRPVSA